MKKFRILFLSFITILAGCDVEVELITPEFTDGSILDNTNEIPIEIKNLIEDRAGKKSSSVVLT